MLQVPDFVGGQPLKCRVAPICAGKGVPSCGIVLLRRDQLACHICVRDIPHSVLQDSVLNGIAVITEGSVFQVHCRFDGIDLVVREDNIIIDHVVPGVGILDIVGIGHVGHDVGEGLLFVLIQAVLVQRGTVPADRPDLQVGRAVRGMQGSRNKLKAAVVIQICDRIIPGSRAVILSEAVDLRFNQLQLLHGLDTALGSESRSAGTKSQ